MSTQLPDPGALRCPICSADVPSDRDWCLECGHAARTRLAPPPSWRRPTAILAIVVAVALAALVFAFVTLTDDDTSGPVGATGATGVTAPVVAPAPTPTGATGPAVAAPPAANGATAASGPAGFQTTTGQAAAVAKAVAEAQAKAQALLGGSSKKP